MKKTHFLFIAAISLMIADSAFADSCESLLCMAGKVQGQSGGSSCDQPIADYFSIVEFGKHGSFDPSKTASARLNFLNSCPGQSAGVWPSQINASYGTVRE